MSLKYFLSMSLGQLRGFIIELVVLGRPLVPAAAFSPRSRAAGSQLTLQRATGDRGRSFSSFSSLRYEQTWTLKAETLKVIHSPITCPNEIKPRPLAHLTNHRTKQNRSKLQRNGQKRPDSIKSVV